MAVTWQASCFREIQRQQQQLKPLRICVLSETESGKTTLIEALFEQLPDSIPLTIEEVSIREWSNEIPEIEQADVILYCVTAEKEQLSVEQRNWLSHIGSQHPVILVITRSIGTKSEIFQQEIIKLQLPLQAIVTVMAQPFPIYEKVVLPAFGLEELLESLEEIVFQKRATLIAGQRVSLAKKMEMSRQRMQDELIHLYGHRLGDVVALDWKQLLMEQQTILARSIVMFSDEQKIKRLIGMLMIILQDEQPLKKSLVSANFPLEQLTGLSACIVANAVVVSACEILSLMYKKETLDLVLNCEELTSLLATKIRSRLKQGKQNPDIQYLMRKQHFIPQEVETVVVQKPIIQIQKKEPDMVQRVKKQSLKVLHHSLDRFSNWIRKS